MMGGASKSRMDDPTTPRYAMSGFHIEMGGFLYAAAIDARQRACPCWHDMATKASVKLEISSIPLRVCGKVVFLQREIPVRGCVPNFGEVTDYMTGFFYCTSILFTQYWTCFPPVITPMVSFTTKSK